MINNLFSKNFKITFLLIVIFEILSFWSHLLNWLNVIIFLFILLITLIFSLKKIEYGFYVVLVELLAASKGYLFYLDIYDIKISIRLGIFLIIMAVWCVKIFKKQGLEFFKKQNQYLYYYLVLGLFVFLGLLNGLINQQFNNTFFDFNGWLYFAYLPVFFSVLLNKTIIKNFLSILFAGVTYICLKTLVLLLIFAHGFGLPLEIIYKWVRNSGVGEITYVSGNFYRIFMQAQIYVLIGLLLSLTIILFSKKIQLNKISIKYLYSISILSSVSILASLSRSFWVGLFVSVILLFIFYIFYQRPKFFVLIKLVSVFLVILVLEVAFLNVITLNFDSSLIKDRLNDPTQDAAGSSRVAQLKPLWQAINKEPVLGSGFGMTVSYISDDPRVKNASPDGLYTTYAFEWGYLDIWLKIGILGLLSYLLVLGKVIKDCLLIIEQKQPESWLILGLGLSFSALIVTSIFSPYLNHPLGIGYLIILSSIIYYYRLNGTSEDKINS